MSAITQRSPPLLLSSAADTATHHTDGALPRAIAAIALPRGQLGRQCRHGTAVQSRIDELQRQLAGAGSNPRSPGATGARHRDHTRQTGRVRQRRPSRGGQPERGAAAVAGPGGVGNYPERADVGMGHQEAGNVPVQLLEALDEVGPTQGQASGRRRNFFGKRPVLMLVEPESLCWLGRSAGETRDGATWAEEFRPYTNLDYVVSDAGTGLQGRDPTGAG